MGSSGSSANTMHWANAGLMLAHHLRRWANIKTVSVQTFRFTESAVGGTSVINSLTAGVAYIRVFIIY